MLLEFFDSRRVIHDTRTSYSDGCIPSVFNVGMVIVKSVSNCHFAINLPTLKRTKLRNVESEQNMNKVSRNSKLAMHSGMFPKVLFRCENVGRQNDFANF